MPFVRTVSLTRARKGCRPLDFERRILVTGQEFRSKHSIPNCLTSRSLRLKGRSLLLMLRRNSANPPDRLPKGESLVLLVYHKASKLLILLPSLFELGLLGDDESANRISDRNDQRRNLRKAKPKNYQDRPISETEFIDSQSTLVPNSLRSCRFQYRSTQTRRIRK